MALTILQLCYLGNGVGSILKWINALLKAYHPQTR